MGLSLLATLKLAMKRLEAAGFQTDWGGDFENARRLLRKRIEISAEFIRCIRDAMGRQVDRQAPCTTLRTIALEQCHELRAENSRAPAWR